MGKKEFLEENWTIKIIYVEKEKYIIKMEGYMKEYLKMVN